MWRDDEPPQARLGGSLALPRDGAGSVATIDEIVYTEPTSVLVIPVKKGYDENAHTRIHLSNLPVLYHCKTVAGIPVRQKAQQSRTELSRLPGV